jgi:hypothetical protein
MINVNDDEISKIKTITITTKCGEATISENLRWTSENKELQKYLNKKFNNKCKILQEGHNRFEIAVYILADKASHHLEGEMISFSF